jgi:hypothetical protein
MTIAVDTAFATNAALSGSARASRALGNLASVL